MTLGCTRYLPSTTGYDVINFQLYSQLDLTHLKLSVHKLFNKPQEYLNNKLDPNFPTDPPEVCSVSVSLPFINYSIRIKEEEIKKLKQLVNEVFPQKYYIEVK